MFTVTGKLGGRAVTARWVAPNEVEGSARLLLEAVDLASVGATVSLEGIPLTASLERRDAALATLLACLERGSERVEHEIGALALARK